MKIVLWGMFLAYFAAVGCTANEKSESSRPGRPDWDSARCRMVKEQLTSPGRSITNARVINAILEVPRHEFIPEERRAEAYEDYPLPIGYGQTISQPYIVAFMTEQLDLKPSNRILEIGAGSGYQAAILSRLVAEVYTIEIVDALAQRAARDLKRLGYDNVKVKSGDGYLGWSEHAPFDAIIVTCAPTKIPNPLLEQLREGGRMIVPVGELHDQMLYLLEKRNQKMIQRAVLPVRFVPMTGAIQQQ
jgi:protein-L-isoaspartate(D-aspartate) O-methyltransferase